MQVKLENDITSILDQSEESGTMDNWLNVAKKRKKTAVIENWFEMSGRLWGQISNHSNQDTFKMETQMTSLVINIDKEAGYAETQSTLYILGKEKLV